MSKRGRSHRAQRLTGVCALVVALLMLVWQAAAFAGPGGGGAGQQSDPGQAQEAPPPAQEDTEAPKAQKKDKEPVSLSDSQANAAQEPPAEEATGGASATASVIDLEAEGTDILVVSESKTEAKDDSCHAEANNLIIVGQLLFGQEADCVAGQDTVSEGDILLLPSCEMSGGVLCIAVLYGYAQATDNADSTDSQSQSDVASVCVGGEQSSPRDPCTSPIGARVAHSESHSTRNKKTGEAGASQESSLLDLCIGGEDPETGVCTGLGIVLLHSEGSAVARPGQTAEIGGESQTICVEAQGEETPICYNGNDLVIPPGCDDVADEERPGALCVALNDGDVTAETGKGSGHQEAISLDAITVIGGSIDQGDLSVDSTKVKGEKVSPPKPPKPPKKPDKKKPTLAGPAGPALANTGVSVIPTILFALALMLLGLRLVRTPAPVRRS